MIENSLCDWLELFLILILSSCAGLYFSSCVPWSSNVKRIGLPFAFGIAIAPFLLGILTIIALTFFSKMNHSIHVVFILISLLLPAILYFLKRNYWGLFFLNKLTVWEWVWIILLSLWIIFLLASSIFLPLIQNDSLEYATVGRLLFETRDLASYPAINPQNTSSGFYGPWTHPPLYPALIYITYALQGSADFPGLMRFITPWCLIGSTVVIYCLGCLANRRTGIVAALLFVSTPLLFLGAGSSLIDAMPVLGMALILAVLLGLQGQTIKEAIIQGIILGLALWTHSQAILFIPLTIIALAFCAEWTSWKIYIRQASILTLVALLIAAPPYLHNLSIFGSLVSDTPAVFALPELAWDEYFRQARGIDSWIERIQYGLFKGWFAIEAYSIIFWLMLCGVIRFIWLDILKPLKTFSFKSISADERWVFPVIILILTYLGGVFLSLLLGIDLMIRNERYWLVLLPSVSLVAAWVFEDFFLNMFKKKQQRFNCLKRLISFLIPWGFTLFLIVQLTVIFGYKFFKEQSFTAKWSDVSELSAIQYLHQKTDPNALVLSLRPADMYYSSRRMISYLDPILIPFYQEKDLVRGWQMLKDLGIDYIYLPAYYLPPVYNSTLQAILADPTLTTLVYDLEGRGGHDTNQVYVLNTQRQLDRRGEEKTIDFSPNFFPWYKSLELILGGRKALASIFLNELVRLDNGYSNTEGFIPLFQRDWSTILVSGNKEASSKDKACISVNSSVEYLLELQLQGHAFVRIFLKQYDAEGNTLTKSVRIGEIILEETKPFLTYQRRFKTLSNTSCIILEVEHLGISSLHIMKATLSPIMN